MSYVIALRKGEAGEHVGFLRDQPPFVTDDKARAMKFASRTRAADRAGRFNVHNAIRLETTAHVERAD